MRIEKIAQSKQPQVVFLCFDDETKLRVRASVVMDYGLYPGMELDEGQLADLTAGAKKASARARAVPEWIFPQPQRRKQPWSASLCKKARTLPMPARPCSG